MGHQKHGKDTRKGIMNIYDAIDAWATAIQGDSTIQTYCTTNFSNGLLVQVDDDNENPISSEAAPYCMLFGYTGGDDSPVTENKIQQARIIVGIVAAGAILSVTTARTASTNGLQKYGAGNLAVDLLDLILAKIKTVTISGNCSLIVSASYDNSGLLFYPLQVVGTTVQIQETKDLSTF